MASIDDQVKQRGVQNLEYVKQIHGLLAGTHYEPLADFFLALTTETVEFFYNHTESKGRSACSLEDDIAGEWIDETVKVIQKLARAAQVLNPAAYDEAFPEPPMKPAYPRAVGSMEDVLRSMGFDATKMH